MDFFSNVEIILGGHCLQLYSAQLMLGKVVIEISSEQLQHIRGMDCELKTGTAVLLKFSRIDSRELICGKKYSAYLTSLRRVKINKFHAVFEFNKLTSLERKEFIALAGRIA